jgi:hypothetical protein
MRFAALNQGARASSRPRQWSFHNPVRVTFGGGALGRLSGILDGRRYLLVTYGGFRFREIATRIAATLFS